MRAYRDRLPAARLFDELARASASRRFDFVDREMPPPISSAMLSREILRRIRAFIASRLRRLIVFFNTHIKAYMRRLPYYESIGLRMIRA